MLRFLRGEWPELTCLRSQGPISVATKIEPPRMIFPVRGSFLRRRFNPDRTSVRAITAPSERQASSHRILFRPSVALDSRMTPRRRNGFGRALFRWRQLTSDLPEEFFFRVHCGCWNDGWGHIPRIRRTSHSRKANPSCAEDPSCISHSPAPSRIRRHNRPGMPEGGRSGHPVAGSHSNRNPPRQWMRTTSRDFSSSVFLAAGGHQQNAMASMAASSSIVCMKNAANR